eukprot:4996747-Alexandrium_andersonii.AAC.1
MSRTDYRGDMGWRNVVTSARGRAEEAVEGYVKVEKAALERILAASGKQGAFAASVGREEPTPRPA